MSERETPNPITSGEALELLRVESPEALESLFGRASAARAAAFSNKVSACSIVNARCGNCPEDCAFCAQSRSSTTEIETYPMISKEEIVAAARHAERDGAKRLGIVTSGRSVSPGRDLDAIVEAVAAIKSETSIEPCASLGLMDVDSLRRLKRAGLNRYHHNLETAGSFFSEICGTRNYDDQIQTIRNAREAGLEVCCGGIFGLGETIGQRVELLDTIRSLEPDSIPLNFLVPIPGTRLADAERVTPTECLKIIAVARLMAPGVNIRVCGGREFNLQDRQADIFRAGADALMIGGYLVTAGNPVEQDKKMIESAGMRLG